MERHVAPRVHLTFPSISNLNTRCKCVPAHDRHPSMCSSMGRHCLSSRNRLSVSVLRARENSYSCLFLPPRESQPSMCPPHRHLWCPVPFSRPLPRTVAVWPPPVPLPSIDIHLHITNRCPPLHSASSLHFPAPPLFPQGLSPLLSLSLLAEMKNHILWTNRYHI